MLAAALLVTVAVGCAAITGAAADVEADPTVTLGTPGTAGGDTDDRAPGPGHARRPPAAEQRRMLARVRRRRPSASACTRTPAPGTFQLAVLDDQLRRSATLPINGVPTRARVSADGRMVAWTTFVGGDSYLQRRASPPAPASSTSHRRAGQSAGGLHGRRPEACRRDANFWGVTFAADDNTFYATMSTGGHLYLVRGDFAAEPCTIAGRRVECPSLSPDGTRLVYKKRLPDPTWQLWVYDLATMRGPSWPSPPASTTRPPGSTTARSCTGSSTRPRQHLRLVGAGRRHRHTDQARRGRGVPLAAARL